MYVNYCKSPFLQPSHQLPVPHLIPYNTPGDASTQSGASCSIASLDNHTRRDLKIQLEVQLRSIVKKYSDYVSCIRESLASKNIYAKNLCFVLLSFTAFNHTSQMLSLLDADRAELEKATDLYGVFSILITKYASFLNYEIFQFIVEKYQIDNGQEELKYHEHLKAYLDSLKVSEFVEINPLLKKYTHTSKECVLKIDIESTARLAKIIDLQTAVAKILGIKSAALQLCDIKDGCVVVTFLISTPVAVSVFNEHTVLTEEQVKQFQAMSVLWLRCNDHTFKFAKKPAKRIKVTYATRESGLIEKEEAFTTQLIPGQPKRVRISSLRRAKVLKLRWTAPTENPQAVDRYEAQIRRVKSRTSNWNTFAIVTRAKFSAN